MHELWTISGTDAGVRKEPLPVELVDRVGDAGEKLQGKRNGSEGKSSPALGRLN